MKIAEPYSVRSQTCGAVLPRCAITPARASFLHLVTSSELADLKNAMGRRLVPPDFAAKLERMAGGDLTRRFIEQNCRLFVALLLAAQEGSFNESSGSDLTSHPIGLNLWVSARANSCNDWCCPQTN